MQALHIWWRALRHLEHRGYIYVWANLCFLATCIPVITAPAGFAGLVRMSHAAHTARSADLNTFWAGVREQLGRGIVLGIITVLIVWINMSNLLAYREVTSLVVLGLRVLWAAAILLWFTLLLYVWPVYYEMKQPTLWGALRNAGVMMLLNPGFTLLLWPGILLTAAISTLIPPLWFLLTFSLYAIVATRAVLNRLHHAGYANPDHMLVSEFSEDNPI